MRSVRFLLSLLFVVYTFNIWAQVEESEFSNVISETSFYENVTIVIYSGRFDGLVYVNGHDQSVWQGQGHYEYSKQLNVHSGEIIRVEAWILGIGYTNTSYVKVPENLRNPCLYINVLPQIYQINAQMKEYN